jgi:hypothetical protein
MVSSCYTHSCSSTNWFKCYEGWGAHIHSQTHNRQTVDLVTILFISGKKAKKGKGSHPLVLDSEARHVLQIFKNFNSVLFEESQPPLDQVPQTVLRGLRKEKGGDKR